MKKWFEDKWNAFISNIFCSKDNRKPAYVRVPVNNGGRNRSRM